MIKGYAGRVLEVDLSRRTFEFTPLDEETARLYIGGKGYGTRLLCDRTEAGIDPLGPHNPLIFATGPLNGSAESGNFETLTRVAAVAVNGVLIAHKRGMRTRLRSGDRVAVVKAASGG